MAAIASINVDLVARTGPSARGGNAARGDLRTFGNGVSRTSRNSVRSFSAIASSTPSLLKNALVIGAVYKAASFGSRLVADSISLAKEAEKTAIAFDALTGSAEAAGRLIGDLRTFAAQSPLTFEASSNIGRQLPSADVVPDQIVPTLEVLGDLAAGDPEEPGRLAHAYSQVKSAGRLMGAELRQSTGTGIPIIPALAEVVKIPKTDARQAVEDGKVGFADLRKAMVSPTPEGGRFHGMAEQYGQSFGGPMEQLRDAVQVTEVGFGALVIDEFGLKDAARDAAAFTARIRGGVDGMRPLVRLGRDSAAAPYRGFHAANLIRAQVARMGGELAPRAGPQRLPEVIGGFIRLGTKGIELGERVVVAFFKVGTAIAKAFIPVKGFGEGIDRLIGDTDRVIRKLDIDGARVATALFDAAESAAVFFSSALDMAEQGFDVLKRVRFGVEDARKAMPRPPAFVAWDKAGPIPEEARLNHGMQFRGMVQDARFPTLLRMQTERLMGGAAPVGGAFDAVAQSVILKAKETSAPRIEMRTDPAVLEISNRANESFGPQADPVRAFRKDVRDLRTGFMGGDIKSFAAFEGAMSDRVRKLRESAGMEFKLPGVVEYGSSEFAKAAIGLVAPKPDMSVTALLKMATTLLEQLKAQNHVDAEKVLQVLGEAVGKPVDLPPR